MKHTIKVNHDGGAELLRQANVLKRKRARKLKNIYHVTMTIILSFLIILIICLANSPKTNANANNEQINSEYAYYGVDNYKDYARSLRKEACYRVWTKILWEITSEQVNHCATGNTLINAYESWFGTSNRCINDNNCMWLKGWSNWYYGFLKFDSRYEANLYFAEKWFTYHYKKSLHTLIYGFKQANWEYRYGWSYTDQETYYIFLRNNYYSVLNEIEKL